MQCIVFTDTKRLAAKYRVSQQDVNKLLVKNLIYHIQVEFLILDAAEYQEELGSVPTIQDYKNILEDFCKGMGLQPSPKLSLFIIGGDDVIPMPRIPNPISENELLHSDIIYCFKGDNISSLDANEAVCNVGRLPLESGSLPSTLSGDLQSYFNLSNMMLETGIAVNSVVMTSTESWMPASNEMVRGLPISAPPAIADATNDNMYISPSHATDNARVMRHYQMDISNADMLVFNLHGSDARGYSSFYGEGLNGHNTPEAFCCEMLKKSGARIINTVACFGGRYIGYNRKDSMLLSAMYGGGVILYAGSCSSALGRTGRIHHVAEDALMPTGYSESMMKLYSLYLFGEMTAGEAFLRAKCDYFNLCQNVDGEDRALATVLMFNLFGMPTLSVNSNKEVLQIARGVKGIRPINGKHFTYKTIYCENSPSSQILNDVRLCVDRNLFHIKNTIETQLYDFWGLNPRDLSKIEEVSDGANPTGYRFEYLNNGNIINKRTWAYLDLSGNVKDVVHFK